MQKVVALFFLIVAVVTVTAGSELLTPILNQLNNLVTILRSI